MSGRFARNVQDLYPICPIEGKRNVLVPFFSPPPSSHRVQDGLVFRIQVAYHREPQVLRESVNAEGMLIVRDNEEAQALEMTTVHKPLLTSMLHG